MSARELLEWTAYEQVYGSLLIHERIDFGLALVAYMQSDGKGELRDFMPPWWQELTAEEERAKGLAWLKGLVG